MRSNELEEISKDYNVYGLKEENGDFFSFKKGENYVGILVSHK